MTLEGLRLVYWRRRLGVLCVPGPTDFTLTHATRGLAGKTLCGHAVPARAVYDRIGTRAWPTCSTCINAVANLEAEP